MREIQVAFDDLQIFIDNDDRGRHFFEKSVGFFLRQLARIRGAHHALRVVRDQRMSKIAAGVVSAASAVQFILGRVLSHGAQCFLQLLVAVFIASHRRSGIVAFDPQRKLARKLAGRLGVVEDVITAARNRCVAPGLRSVHARSRARGQFKKDVVLGLPLRDAFQSLLDVC